MNTKFGLSQIKNHTPDWVKIVFGIIITLTTTATFLIASTSEIRNDLKVEINVWIKAFEMLVFGISKLFGLEPDSITSLEEKSDNNQSEK